MALLGVSFPGVSGYGAWGAPVGQGGPQVFTSTGRYNMPAGGSFMDVPGAGWTAQGTTTQIPGMASTGGGTAAGGATSGNTNWAWQNLQPAQVAYPSQQLQSFSDAAKNYPQWMRSMGENAAQEAYQRQINSGIRLGAGPQAVWAADQARNNARLGYMAQAGQEELKIGSALEDMLIKLYGLDITQRGQNVDYITAMRQAAAQEQAALNREGSSTIRVGGVLPGSNAMQSAATRAGTTGSGGIQTLSQDVAETVGSKLYGSTSGWWNNAGSSASTSSW